MFGVRRTTKAAPTPIVNVNNDIDINNAAPQGGKTVTVTVSVTVTAEGQATTETITETEQAAVTVTVTEESGPCLTTISDPCEDPCEDVTPSETIDIAPVPEETAISEEDVTSSETINISAFPDVTGNNLQKHKHPATPISEFTYTPQGHVVSGTVVLTTPVGHGSTVSAIA